MIDSNSDRMFLQATRNENRRPSIILFESNMEDKESDIEKSIGLSNGSQSAEQAMTDSIQEPPIGQINEELLDPSDTYVGDVQGPINREPDEKLSPANRKPALKVANLFGSRISKGSSIVPFEENSLNEPILSLNSNTPQESSPSLVQFDLVTAEKTGHDSKKLLVVANGKDSSEINQSDKLGILMQKSAEIINEQAKRSSLILNDSDDNSSSDSNTSHYKSTSNLNKMSHEVPTFELDTSSCDPKQLQHAKTNPDFEHTEDYLDQVDFNVTPPNKKNLQKHEIRHSIASSPGNMNSYAFMHTYNNFPNSTRTSPSQTNLNTSGDKKNKKPWYSAFTNSYKQKNDEFKKLFKLPQDEHLLVDYSCALQKEILAHGRLYISLNYLCFRANIIGWETTVSIKLKDICKIFKDKTAKIIPNAITVLLENERFFFTSLASRDKTYTTLFRVWQIALADASMSNEEIKMIVKNSYGNDLGYDTAEEASDEFVGMLTAASEGDFIPDFKKDQEDEMISDMDHSKRESNGSSSGDASLFLQENVQNISNATEKLIKSSLSVFGHRQSSSYDTSYINKMQNEDDERPISMLVSKQPSPVALSQSKLQKSSPTHHTNGSHGGNNNETSQLSLKSMGTNNSDPDKLSIPDDNNNTRKSIPHSEGDQEIISNSSNNLSASIENGIIENRGESSSESIESETIETAETITNSNNVKCSCSQHQGKETMNQVFNFSVNFLFECLMGSTEFRKKYWESRKFGSLKVGAWAKSPAGSNFLHARLLEYTIDLGTLGKPENNENQRIVEYKPDSCIVIDSESETRGVLYSDHFRVNNRFCLTRVSEMKTRLTINSFINYIMRPNFIVKSFIERNTYSTIKDSFNYLEKNLPNVKQPLSVPFHISAITNSQTKIDQPSSISTLLASTPTSSNNTSSQNINNSEADLNTPLKASESTKTYRIQKKSASSNVHASNNKVRGQRGGGGVKDSNHQNLIYNPEAQNDDEYNQINPSISSQQFQPQMVPIQTFSFFKWKINVDTLVRIFIIAMICLMVINAMLYFKLRRIETLADGLRNDPNILEKIAAIKSSCGHNQFKGDNKFNEHSLSHDLIGWRDVISNTLNVIQKMEDSLKEWDKSLENRQILASGNSVQTNNNINTNNELNSRQGGPSIRPDKSDDL